MCLIMVSFDLTTVALLVKGTLVLFVNLSFCADTTLITFLKGDSHLEFTPKVLCRCLVRTPVNRRRIFSIIAGSRSHIVESILFQQIDTHLASYRFICGWTYMSSIQRAHTDI